MIDKYMNSEAASLNAVLGRVWCDISILVKNGNVTVCGAYKSYT